MFEKLELTKMAQALAAHAGRRMGYIAQNVANADTPGFKALALKDFDQVYQSAPSGMKATRAGHFGTPTGDFAPQAHSIASATSPNGNSVSLEKEMVTAAEVRRDHEMALAVYRNTSDILRASLGRGR